MWHKMYYTSSTLVKLARLRQIFSVVVSVFLMMGGLYLQSALAAKPHTCTKVAENAKIASKNEIRDDFWIAIGKCNNLADDAEKKICRKMAKEEFQEAKDLRIEQFKARRSLCKSIGEQPYDPTFIPADFVDFEAVVGGAPFTPNLYFPLVPGTVWNYRATDGNGNPIEESQVEVLAEFKEILGINCIVVHDVVWEVEAFGGTQVLIEDTYDWYAQDLAGNVWYFGEIAANYEGGELIDTEGSWKGGRDYDVPGIVMLADPQAGDVYRQEFSLGNAEDAAEVIGYVDGVVVGATTYDNVLKTHDFTPIEPDVLEYKYYAPGVGFIFEEKPADAVEEQEFVELHEFLPAP